MKKFQTATLVLFTVFMLSVMIGCEGNDDDKDSDHDSKISSMSTAIDNLTGANEEQDIAISANSATTDHVDGNGCTDAETWTPAVEEVLDPDDSTIVLTPAVKGFCS